MSTRILIASLTASLTAPLALSACSTSNGLPTAPPTKIAMVTSGGFTSPSDAVASPDGKEFYFLAYDAMLQPALFRTASEPGATAEELAAGAPLAAPIGLVLSCDGGTIYIADLGADTIFSLPTAGGVPSDLAVSGILSPGGLAMGPGCKQLYATGKTAGGQPALFTVPTTGGSADLVYAGAPLVSPTGLHVDDQGVAWVMDHLAAGDDGEGVLFAIPSDGSSATVVASGLHMGTPGGVSLTAGGGTAVIPSRDDHGAAQLLSIDIATGATTQLAAPDMIDPAGLRTARRAGVFAVVDSEGGAIYRAE